MNKINRVSRLSEDLARNPLAAAFCGLANLYNRLIPGDLRTVSFPCLTTFPYGISRLNDAYYYGHSILHVMALLYPYVIAMGLPALCNAITSL